MFTFEVTKLPESSLSDSGNRFLQSPFWAAFKQQHGWCYVRFAVQAVSQNETYRFELTVLVRTFKKIFSLAYIPMAPEVATDSNNYPVLLSELTAAICAYVPKNTICVRYDIPVDLYTCDERTAFNARFVKASRSICKTSVDIQPPDTVLLDITPDTDALLAHMKSKWRYNIRLAEKKGVIVKAYTKESPDFDAALNAYYELYKTTAERDGIAIHKKKYYEDLFTLSAELRKQGVDAPVITLYLATHENDTLAGIITLFCKREAVYLYGASGNVKRNMMPAYLLQWTAIQDAKKYGSPVYDFYGIPPTGDEGHPMHGLYLFKTGFGGTEIHRPGSFDVPVSKLYHVYACVEVLRAFWHKRVLKVIRGR